MAAFLAAAAVLALPLALPAQTPPKYVITTMAGTGSAGFSGDAGQASAAQINFPLGLALDSNGVLYFADQLNHRIRAIATDGTIKTVAGTGTADNTGDGAAATSATLNTPTGVYVDGSGNFFILDTANNQVRKVTSSGTISRYAGTGNAGYSGDTAAANLAAMNTPLGITLDTSGNAYIADTANSRIRKVGGDGGINTFAGTGVAAFAGDGGAALSASFNRPYSLAFDSAGNLYVADTYNHRIRKIAADGTVSTVAGMGSADFWGDEGPATSAALNYPTSVIVDASGNLYIADCLNSRIRMVTEDGKIHTIAGNGEFGFYGDNGPATQAAFSFPYSLARDNSGRIYVSDNQNSRLRLLTPQPAGDTPAIRAATVNSAFGGFTSVAPGSWIEIYGSKLAASTREWSGTDFENGQAPTSLAGTRVTVAGLPAAVAYVSPGQVNAQVPLSVDPGNLRLRVITEAGVSEPYNLKVSAAQAGMFAPAAFQIGSKRYVSATLPDGLTNVLPESAVPGVKSRPARAGETITLYGTGFGTVTPRVAAGEVTRQSNSLDTSLEISFGDVQASIAYAGLAPGAVGVYQFSVVVPAGVTGDAVPLSFKLGGVRGQQSLFTAVSQ